MITSVSPLTPKDIMRVRNLSSRQSAHRYIKSVKAKLGKEPHQDLTVSDYANHTGVDLDELIKSLA